METVPLIPVFLPEPQPQLPPLEHKDVKCDDETSCPDGETCCKMSDTTWGCCPFPNRYLRRLIPSSCRSLAERLKSKGNPTGCTAVPPASPALQLENVSKTLRSTGRTGTSSCPTKRELL
uniref:Granulins domain-containing protein n=1 Tax=Labrus bergylta TaxID=56723 RepID=A0A3Q3EEZ3_9LABR